MFDNISHPQKRAFLAAYSECGNVRAAAKIALISRETHYDWLGRDPAYAAGYKLARLKAGDALEAAAYHRARHGVSDLVLYEGQVVEIDTLDPKTGAIVKKRLTKRRHSDSLVRMLLAGLKPDEYADNKTVHEVTGPGGGPVECSLEVSRVLRGATEEELNLLERIARKAIADRSRDADAGGVGTPREADPAGGPE